MYVWALTAYVVTILLAEVVLDVQRELRKSLLSLGQVDVPSLNEVP